MPDTRISHTCTGCGKPHMAWKQALKRRGVAYCTRRCAVAHKARCHRASRVVSAEKAAMRQRPRRMWVDRIGARWWVEGNEQGGGWCIWRDFGTGPVKARRQDDPVTSREELEAHLAAFLATQPGVVELRESEIRELGVLG